MVTKIEVFPCQGYCEDGPGDDGHCEVCARVERREEYVPSDDLRREGVVIRQPFEMPCPACGYPVMRALVDYKFEVHALLCSDCDHWVRATGLL